MAGVLIVILIGGVLPVFERKVLALTQRRVGPKFIGYKGRLQFIADSLKTLFKLYHIPKNTQNYWYVLIPILLLNINLYMFGNVFWYNKLSLFHNSYPIFILLVVALLSNILSFWAGIIIQNSYTLLSSQRILNLMFTNELLITIFVSLLIVICNSLNYKVFSTFSLQTCWLPYHLYLIPIMLVVFLLDNHKVPFDLVEAETELIMGYHVEYSGMLFGIFILVEYIHIFFFCYLLSVFIL